jgi:predicted RNase H-like HicB family nuclease
MFRMGDSLKLSILYQEGEDGFVIASIPEVPGTFSQGRTRAEARANVIDALRLMLTPEPGTIDDATDSELLELTIGP